MAMLNRNKAVMKKDQLRPRQLTRPNQYKPSTAVTIILSWNLDHGHIEQEHGGDEKGPIESKTADKARSMIEKLFF